MWEPDSWKARYANPAFVRARADDRFWAAQKLQALTADHMAAAVRSAEYGDAAAEQIVTMFLLQRRAASLRHYLTGVNPAVDPQLDPDGILTFGNAAVDADLASSPAGDQTVWSCFDNTTGNLLPIGTRSSRSTTVVAPQSVTPRPEARRTGAARISAFRGLRGSNSVVDAVFLR